MGWVPGSLALRPKTLKKPKNKKTNDFVWFLLEVTQTNQKTKWIIGFFAFFGLPQRKTIQNHLAFSVFLVFHCFFPSGSLGPSHSAPKPWKTKKPKKPNDFVWFLLEVTQTNQKTKWIIWFFDFPLFLDLGVPVSVALHTHRTHCQNRLFWKFN